MSQPPSPEQIAAGLFASLGAEEALYLVLDASRSAEICPVVEALSDEALCLFDGEAKEDLAEVAPWLVPLTPGCDVLDWYLDNGAGQDWGIFLAGPPQARRIKTALKRSLMVQDEDGREMYFKFYRPSVMRQYLPGLDPDQQAYITRGLTAIWAEEEAEALQLVKFIPPTSDTPFQALPMQPQDSGCVTWG